MKLKNFVTLAITLVLGLSASIGMAKSLKLLEEPKADAKVVGTVDTEKGIMTIFTPKNSEWIKIADPSNGNVGWVKQADLKSATGFSFSQEVISGNKAPNSYQIIQYGGPQQLTNEEAQAIAKRARENQEAIQKSVQKWVTDIYKNIDQQMKNMPVIMPIIVVPQPETQPAAKPSTETKH